MPFPKMMTKKRMATFVVTLALSGLYTLEAKAAEKLHCTVILDAESGAVLTRDGFCDKAFAPQSSFKFPLAVMGYDAGILKDAITPRWDYKAQWKRPKREQKSVDPTIWERDSIVWYSQEITLRLGKAKFANYVQRFGYGNADVSGVPGQTEGLTEAWLMSSLKISGDQQVDFLRRFITGKLPVSKEAITKTQAIIPQFSAADGWQVHGKTGSGRMRTKANTYDGDWWLGWFVGWAQKGERKVVFASLHIEDWKSEEPISFATRDALIADLPKFIK
ncbi:class D beta-lactamase [Agrobacterium larrymoorei]